MINTYNRHITAHLGVMSNRFCELPDSFDLEADYETPRSYLAYETDNCGNRLRAPATKQPFRVKVDHEATGTATAGTGDTVVRRI